MLPKLSKKDRLVQQASRSVAVLILMDHRRCNGVFHVLPIDIVFLILKLALRKLRVKRRRVFV